MFNLRCTHCHVPISSYHVDIGARTTVIREGCIGEPMLEFKIDTGSALFRACISQGVIQSYSLSTSTENMSPSDIDRFTEPCELTAAVPLVSLECESKRVQDIITLHDGVVVERNAELRYTSSGAMELVWAGCDFAYGNREAMLMFTHDGWLSGARFGL